MIRRSTFNVLKTPAGEILLILEQNDRHVIYLSSAGVKTNSAMVWAFCLNALSWSGQP